MNQIAENYGRQAIVVAIDARRRCKTGLDPYAGRASLQGPAARWAVSTYGGTKPTGLDALEWAREVEELARAKSC